jgi:hypothetical protein
VLVTGIQQPQVIGLRDFFATQTRVGWIPVTSTGMREVGAPTAETTANLRKGIDGEQGMLRSPE